MIERIDEGVIKTSYKYKEIPSITLEYLQLLIELVWARSRLETIFPFFKVSVRIFLRFVF